MTGETFQERPEKKPSHESWDSFAERRIRDALEDGTFENLPGFGKPIPDIDRPLDENWWIRRKLKREEFSALPPVLEARLEAEKTLEAIRSLSSETQVRRRLEKLNDTIRKAHFSHVPGPPDGVAPVDIEAIVIEWKKYRQSAD